jgi:hypothetical protein
MSDDTNPKAERLVSGGRMQISDTRFAKPPSAHERPTAVRPRRAGQTEAFGRAVAVCVAWTHVGSMPC